MGNLSSLDFKASVVGSGNGGSTQANPDDLLDLNQKIQSTALFNDAFISSIVDKIPSFGLEDPTDDATGEKKSSDSDTKDSFVTLFHSEEQMSHLTKLMKIFSPENKSPEKVEDHPILSGETSSEKSTKSNSAFEVMRLRRTRLLIQLLKVMSSVLMSNLFLLTSVFDIFLEFLSERDNGVEEKRSESRKACTRREILETTSFDNESNFAKS